MKRRVGNAAEGRRGSNGHLLRQNVRPHVQKMGGDGVPHAPASNREQRANDKEADAERDGAKSACTALTSGASRP